MATIKTTLTLTLFCLITLFSFGQSAHTSRNDSTVDDWNDDRIVFTRAEHMPGLYNGGAALEDTLTSVLRQFGSTFQKGTFLFSLTIGRNGVVKDVSRQGDLSEPLQIEAQVIAALKNTTGMWSPATQNGRPVNCYERIYIKFNKRTLEVLEKR